MPTKENKLSFSFPFALNKQKFAISVFRLQQANENCCFPLVQFFVCRIPETWRRGNKLLGRSDIHIQGGAVNCGLFFADAPLSLLGAVCGKISEIARQQPKLLRKYSGGDEQIRCCRGDRLPPRNHSELCAEWKNMKIFEGLSKNKIMVLNMKKLLNVGVSLTLR